MKWSFLLFVLLGMTGVKAQDISYATRAVVNRIEKGGSLDHEFTGPEHLVSDQYQAYTELRKTATTKELYTLIFDQNPVVKGYASWALADRRYPKPFDVFREFYRSGERVPAMDGCVRYQPALAEAFYERLLSHDYQWATTQDQKIFTEELRKMDSLILYGLAPGGYGLYRYVTAHNAAHPAWYPRIRELAITTHNTDLIAELGSYRQKKDIPAIIKLDSLAFPAIAQFPDTAFRKLMVKYKGLKTRKHYAEALAAFKSKEAAKTFTELYPTLTASETEDLDVALTRQFSPLYTDLVLDIWATKRMIHPAVLPELVMNKPNESSEAFARGLKRDLPDHFILTEGYTPQADSALKFMLRHIGRYNPELLADVCSNNLQRPGTPVKPFLDMIAYYRITGTTAQLFTLLKQTRSATELYELSATLYALNNTGIDRQVAQLLKQRKKEWQDAYNAQAIRELMRVNS
ncbi:MAG: hypothetical protein V4616_04935 [Bacteroidota bacterium]